MFRKEQKNAIHKVFSRLELEDFSDEAMLQMVSAFPTLTSDEKRIVREKIKESTERVKKGGKKISPKELEEINR